MSTFPVRRPIFYDPWMEYFDRRMKLFDQNFGMGLTDEDIMLPWSHSPFFHWPTRRRLSHPEYGNGVSQVTYDKDKFQIKLDVQQFAPEEIVVKTVNNFIVIEGKHEEKQDEHGFISRHFVRRYMIPPDVKPENICCDLSSDKVLVISAPTSIQTSSENEVVIPITHTENQAVDSNKKDSEP